MYDTECWVRSSPAVSGNRIYLGDGSAAEPRGLDCLSDNLQLHWWVQGDGPGTSGEWTCGTVAFHGDSIWVPGGELSPDIYCVKDNGNGQFDREIVWEADLGAQRDNGQPVSPAVAGNSVFMAVSRELSSGAIGSVLCRLDARTGDVVQEFDLGLGKVLSSPAIWEGKVYVGTADGRLLCFGW